MVIKISVVKHAEKLLNSSKNEGIIHSCYERNMFHILQNALEFQLYSIETFTADFRIYLQRTKLILCAFFKDERWALYFLPELPKQLKKSDTERLRHYLF